MAEKKLESIKGTVEEITFYNQDNGYTVMEISCGNEAVTVVGNFSQLAVGSQIEASGEWTVHPSYGRQFKADSLTETLPQDAAGILRYLSSGIIKGVGRATAEKIVNAFGSESFGVIEKDVDRLSSIKGISKPAARKIQRSFIEKFASRQTIEDLKQKGLTHKEAFDAYNFFMKTPLRFLMITLMILSRQEFMILTVQRRLPKSLMSLYRQVCVRSRLWNILLITTFQTVIHAFPEIPLFERQKHIFPALMTMLR